MKLCGLPASFLIERSYDAGLREAAVQRPIWYNDRGECCRMTGPLHLGQMVDGYLVGFFIRVSSTSTDLIDLKSESRLNWESRERWVLARCRDGASMLALEFQGPRSGLLTSVIPWPKIRGKKTKR